MRTTILATLLAMAVSVFGAQTPIRNGVLQSDLDANGHAITHAGALTVTNLTAYNLIGLGLQSNVATTASSAGVTNLIQAVVPFWQKDAATGEQTNQLPVALQGGILRFATTGGYPTPSNGVITVWADNSFWIGTNFYVLSNGGFFTGNLIGLGMNGPFSFPATRPTGWLQVNSGGSVSGNFDASSLTNFIFKQWSSAPTAGQIGGTVGAVTNYLPANVNGVLSVYYSDGTTLWSKQLAP